MEQQFLVDSDPNCLIPQGLYHPHRPGLIDSAQDFSAGALMTFGDQITSRRGSSVHHKMMNGMTSLYPQDASSCDNQPKMSPGIAK